MLSLAPPQPFLKSGTGRFSLCLITKAKGHHRVEMMQVKEPGAKTSPDRLTSTHHAV